MHGCLQTGCPWKHRVKSRENHCICFTCAAASDTWAHSGSGAERSGLVLTGGKEEEIAGAETARVEWALSEAARLTTVGEAQLLRELLERGGSRVC